MSILYVLIPLGLVLIGVAAWAFFWAVNHGQFDDLETPAISILADDEHENRDIRGPGISADATPSTPAEPGAGAMPCGTTDPAPPWR